jgi:hypothetical protein
MKKKAVDSTIDSGLMSKRSNTIVTQQSNSNLVMIKTNKVTKTTIGKFFSKTKESAIKPIANNNLKKIIDDENKKMKALNDINHKNSQIKDDILEMLIKKNLEMLDLEYYMKEYKDSFDAIESFPQNFQESRVITNANLQFLDEQLKKANDLINNLHLKNSNLEIMIKLREEEIKAHEETVLYN